MHNTRKPKKSKYSRDNFKGYLRASLIDLYEFYTPAEKRKKSESYWPVFRFCYKCFWFLHGVSKTLRISRYRWILIIISVVLFLNQGNTDNNSIAYIILFFVLLLEIRDKLLAHDELKAGSAIQNALMPEQQPRVPGWDVWLYSKPARLVGGDYIDVHSIDANCCGLAIGDVSGKGLAAALLMAKLQASVEALSSHSADIAEMTQKLNNLFCKPSLRSQFISFLYVQLQKPGGEINFVNAGHLPPWIIRNSHISIMPKGEPALGLLADQTYSTHQEHLDSGDVFLAVTDGCTEVRRQDGTFLDENDFLRSAQRTADKSARDIGSALLTHLLEFSADAVQHDDMTIMVLKRK